MGTETMQMSLSSFVKVRKGHPQVWGRKRYLVLDEGEIGNVRKGHPQIWGRKQDTLLPVSGSVFLSGRDIPRYGDGKVFELKSLSKKMNSKREIGLLN